MMKNEKGAITLYVVVVCLFIITIGVLSYITTGNKQATQLQQLDQMEQNYGSGVTQDELYNQYLGGDIVPIYSEEQFLKIGSNESMYINGKIYEMAYNKTYILKRNLESNTNFQTIINSVENANGVIIKEYE